MNLNISYRGLLHSCNYSCHYCPMAMTSESKEQKEKDRAALQDFFQWIVQHPQHRYRVLITPWGEALVRRWYREKMIQLSHLSHVEQITAQTNLSRKPDWLQDANKESLSLWVTYHPEQVSQAQFLQHIDQLEALNVRYTVGMVGKPEYLEEINAMRSLLPEHRYLWVNAYRAKDKLYSQEMLEQLNQIDPHFDDNNCSYSSLNKACDGGESSLFVNGHGDIHPCHFVDQKLTSIYDEHWEQKLAPQHCPNQECNCYIGYIHLRELNMNAKYGKQRLARIPIEFQN
ncbi:STM4011 family radical SAM protein [Pleionea sp. CnH1-48]|uniref:STM4011 family radical SAM protein n=1 Tax=Pleionea sp. CnH1-48 TaxID=2954494 RepID=UPI0020970C5A|nr:STM4011 family radical SAM protein [Pleionea sp. CnH1-48]MCO7225103.1 STM4011 family radical SAM protein [Pleionea sp. CnH1-48]